MNKDLMVPFEKIPEFEEEENRPVSNEIAWINYINQFYEEIAFNNGYYFRNCQTRKPNNQCYYLYKGCKACKKV